MTQRITRLIGVMVVIMTLISFTQSIEPSKEIPKFTLVEVSPSALGVMIHSFDQVLIFFHNEQNSTDLDVILKEYESKIGQIKSLYPNDHTLFAHINRTSDFMGRLSHFGKQNGLKLINTFHDIHYNGSQDLVEFYTDHVHPKLPLIYRSDLKKIKETKYKLLFEYSNFDDLEVFNKMYQKILHFLPDFHTKCYALAKTDHTKSTISLYKDEQNVTTFSFFNRTIKEAADELVQSINIDTLPSVITLNDSTFNRVFGGSISDQLVLVYKDTTDIQKVLEQYNKAAHSNRYDALAYERVLFTTVDSHFFSQNFNEDINEILNDSSYVIYFTKTDYDRFQLKKYRFSPSSQQWISQQLLQFIEDVRLKKLDPQYKSEPIPTQEEQNEQILRKIVGKTFISQIYEKPDQSIIVLFVDSKAEQSYTHLKKLLEEFTIKYKKTIEGKLVTAIFDLNKNQHKLLYLKEAPQLILFDKSNKKQTKYLKITEQLTLDGLTSEIKKSVTNVVFNESNDL